MPDVHLQGLRNLRHEEVVQLTGVYRRRARFPPQTRNNTYEVKLLIIAH